MQALLAAVWAPFERGVRRLREAGKHVYWALRYGEWSVGWENYKDKPKFGVFFMYYDGHHCALHFGPGWISVYY